MRIGYITHRKGIISRLGNSYLESLMKAVKHESFRKMHNEPCRYGIAACRPAL